MKVHDVFARIATHQVEGMMLHDQMADAFAFLGLMGFKRMHEYHFADESKNMRMTHKYFINHYNMLLEGGHPVDPQALPHSWMGYTRQQVTHETKRKAVRDLLTRWVEWEKETKEMYEHAYAELISDGQAAAAMRVKTLMIDVDEELEHAEKLHLRLESIMYDMPTIDQMQDGLCAKYTMKIKNLFEE